MKASPTWADACATMSYPACSGAREIDDTRNEYKEAKESPPMLKQRAEDALHIAHRSLTGRIAEDHPERTKKRHDAQSPRTSPSPSRRRKATEVSAITYASTTVSNVSSDAAAINRS